jgi:hypothetical protein
MGITTSSSNKLFIIGALLVARGVFAEEYKCPSYHDKHPLATATLFDGPPEEKADLMPETTTGKGSKTVSAWNVGTVYANGRALFLVCRYSGLDNTNNVTVKAERKVERCTFRPPAKGRPAQMMCK